MMVLASTQARADVHYLYAARALRGFGDGFAIIILPAYLLALGLSPGQESVPIVPTRNRCPNPCFEMDIVKAHIVSNDRGRVRILRSNEKPSSIGHRSLEVPELDRGIDSVRPHENLHDARCFAVWLRPFLVPEMTLIWLGDIEKLPPAMSALCESYHRLHRR
jgi:hypothetical protein